MGSNNSEDFYPKSLGLGHKKTLVLIEPDTPMFFLERIEGDWYLRGEYKNFRIMMLCDDKPSISLGQIKEVLDEIEQ